MNVSKRKTLIENEFVWRFGKTPILFVQAPGRVDSMGSHTDYNLGYVLTEAIDRNTWIAAKPRSDCKVRIASLNAEGCTNSIYQLSSVTSQLHGPIMSVVWPMFYRTKDMLSAGLTG